MPLQYKHNMRVLYAKKSGLVILILPGMYVCVHGCVHAKRTQWVSGTFECVCVRVWGDFLWEGFGCGSITSQDTILTTAQHPTAIHLLLLSPSLTMTSKQCYFALTVSARKPMQTWTVIEQLLLDLFYIKLTLVTQITKQAEKP